MKEVVIAGYVRTAQSRSRPNDPARDVFFKLRTDELLARILPEVIKRAGIKPEEIDDFLVGSALGVAEQWTWGGRTPLILADLPDSIPAKFIDQQCGSAMAGIHMGFMEIAQGFADVVLVAGAEHMTRVPMGGPTVERGKVAPNLAMFTDPKYSRWDINTGLNMGLTAEKLAEKSGISRQAMDDWGVRSHRLADQAQKDGFFSGEILPVQAPQDDGSMLTVDRDQAVRGDVTVEGMAELRPAFKKNGGVITAGNAAPLNAGASAMVLVSKETALEKNLRPLAAIRSIGFAGVPPALMGEGPVPASQKALSAIGLEPRDMDYWEINEAFCVVALNCIQALGLDPDRVNIKGGGTALGHPLGATGIRLVGTLARILEEKDGRWGCANACVGGGQGVATIIEREK